MKAPRIIGKLAKRVTITYADDAVVNPWRVGCAVCGEHLGGSSYDGPALLRFAMRCADGHAPSCPGPTATRHEINPRRSAAARKGGMHRSERKAQSSRANGRRGGRPPGSVPLWAQVVSAADGGAVLDHPPVRVREALVVDYGGNVLARATTRHGLARVLARLGASVRSRTHVVAGDPVEPLPDGLTVWDIVDLPYKAL